MKLTTDTDVTAEIEAALIGSRQSPTDFDVDKIASACFEYVTELGGYVQTVDEDGFWAAVEDAAL